MATEVATGKSNDTNMSETEEKKLAVFNKLHKSDEDRKTEVQRKRDERSLVTAATENTTFFTENFAKEKNQIETELLACESLPKNQLIDKFDSISMMHQQLQKFLTESTMFLPSYDVRQGKETLAKLQTQIQDKRDVLIPKKKFAFKSKTKGSKEKPAVQKEEKHDETLQVNLAECKFTDMGHKTLEKSPEEINLKDVALARLDSCTVKLYGAPSAIHINKLTNCTVLAGPVSGSIFITECKDCTFVVACQQLRIHTTTDTKFYIHVTSRAIIEDTQRVAFGPYTWSYPDTDKHYQLSGLDKTRNSWDDIDDFNWLAADAHSPNWSLIPSDEQVKTWK